MSEEISSGAFRAGEDLCVVPRCLREVPRGEAFCEAHWDVLSEGLQRTLLLHDRNGPKADWCSYLNAYARSVNVLCLLQGDARRFEDVPEEGYPSIPGRESKHLVKLFRDNDLYYHVWGDCLCFETSCQRCTDFPRFGRFEASEGIEGALEGQRLRRLYWRGELTPGEGFPIESYCVGCAPIRIKL